MDIRHFDSRFLLFKKCFAHPQQIFPAGRFVIADCYFDFGRHIS